MNRTRFEPICLILGAGGVRGFAHLGVLEALLGAGVPIGAIVGCSVGGLVGAYHAGLGLGPGEMRRIGDRITGGALLAHAAAHWTRRRERAAGGLAGTVLRPLREASFDRLRGGVRSLGITAFDLVRRRRIVFTGGGEHGRVGLADAAIGGAAIPILFPPKRIRLEPRGYRLIDAGLLDAVPVEAALAPPFDRGPVIAVDLSIRMGLRQRRRRYWPEIGARLGGRLLVLRPRVRCYGTVLFRRRDVDAIVRAGRESVTPERLAELRRLSAEWRAAARPSP